MVGAEILAETLAMTINLDTEIVATRYDPQKRSCFYTVERNAKRWTAEIPLDALNALGPIPLNKAKRQQYVAKVLTDKMMEAPDVDHHQQ